MRLAKALVGVAEANALAAESIASERGVGPQQIAQTEALALHAAAFNGMPDPVFHLTARAMAIVTGLAAVEPDPRAPDNDVLLDAALQAATGSDSAAEREAATACLLNAEAELTKAARARDVRTCAATVAVHRKELRTCLRSRITCLTRSTASTLASRPARNARS